METKDGLKVNMYGQVILSSDKIRELILQGKNIDKLNVVTDDEIRLFDKYQEELLSDFIKFTPEQRETLTIDDFHQQSADNWLFPEKYKTLDVYNWLINKCKSQIEIDRVNEEYQLYYEKDLIMVLRLFIFIVDCMRENKCLWGVGRGSSVSSYILYLIGVHRVDSIRYNLSISDYLK